MTVDLGVRAIDLESLRFSTPDIMTELGQRAVELARARVAEGIGSDGAPMAPYSARTVRERTAAGLESSVRDLDATGEMLDARAVTDVTDTKVTVGFPDELAAEKASDNEDRTPWIAPPPEERAAIVAAARDLITEQIRNELARVRAEKG